MLRKLNRLIEECLRRPFEGAGKPEPLKNDLAGFWSRRIDREHRPRPPRDGDGDRIHPVSLPLLNRERPYSPRVPGARGGTTSRNSSKDFQAGSTGATPGCGA